MGHGKILIVLHRDLDVVVLAEGFAAFGAFFGFLRAGVADLSVGFFDAFLGADDAM